MQSQLKRAKSRNTKLWQASQQAAIAAAGSASFATEFKTLFTDLKINQLPLEILASQDFKLRNLLLTADHFLEVIGAGLKVIKVILLCFYSCFVESFTQSCC